MRSQFRVLGKKIPIDKRLDGDAAASFVLQTMLVLPLNFYTDVLGIAASMAGSLIGKKSS
jgi:hypothetical protein